jgi:hypothetical protein
MRKLSINERFSIGMFDSRRLMCAVSLTPTNSKASCKLSFCAKEKVLDGIAPFTVVL